MINCAFENGDKVNLRHITLGVIIVKDSKILLGKRGSFNGKPILESGKWGLIGGFLDRDETFEEGIRREVLEETGWEIDNLVLFRINDSPNRPKEDRQNVDIIFTANAVKQTVIKTEEVKELKWFDLMDLPQDADFAFDHADSIKMYIQLLQNNL